MLSCGLIVQPFHSSSPQPFNTSTLQAFNTSTLRLHPLNPLALQPLNPSTFQPFRPSTLPSAILQSFNPSTLQSFIQGGEGVEGLSGLRLRVFSIQVRIASPTLGVFKGILCKKLNISRIQLTASMRKVGPSTYSSAGTDWAWVLVTCEHPTTNNLQIGKWVTGGTPCKTFKQKELSPMLKRLLRSLGVPAESVSRYARGHLRKEAWVAGVADPTYALPAGHVFISGLPAELIPCIDGHYYIFMTRSP